MKIRAVLKRLVAVAHAGEESAALERIVGSLDKQQRGKVHGRWSKGERRFALALPSPITLADCLAVLGEDETRVGWPAATRACNGKGV